jgi:hypothetical protein
MRSTYILSRQRACIRWPCNWLTGYVVRLVALAIVPESGLSQIRFDI